MRGDFFFDCDDNYECDDTATIAYDFKRKRFVPVGTKGSLVIGAALLPTPKGSKFVDVALTSEEYSKAAIFRPPLCSSRLGMETSMKLPLAMASLPSP